MKNLNENRQQLLELETLDRTNEFVAYSLMLKINFQC